MRNASFAGGGLARALSASASSFSACDARAAIRSGYSLATLSSSAYLWARWSAFSTLRRDTSTSRSILSFMSGFPVASAFSSA